MKLEMPEPTGFRFASLPTRSAASGPRPSTRPLGSFRSRPRPRGVARRLPGPVRPARPRRETSAPWGTSPCLRYLALGKTPRGSLGEDGAAGSITVDMRYPRKRRISFIVNDSGRLVSGRWRSFDGRSTDSAGNERSFRSHSPHGALKFPKRLQSDDPGEALCAWWRGGIESAKIRRPLKTTTRVTHLNVPSR